MKCRVCGAESAEGARFCQKCGAALNEGQPPPATPGVAAKPGLAATPGLATGRRGPDPPEQVLWEGSYSPKAMTPWLVAGVLASVALLLAAVMLAGEMRWIALAVLLVLWAAIGLQLASRRLGIHYRLTNQMLYHRHGLLTRVTNRIEAIDIHDVTYEQGLLDRMLGIGRIKISSTDRTDPILRLDGIEQVEHVAGLIDKARRAERIRRGVSIDAV